MRQQHIHTCVTCAAFDETHHDLESSRKHAVTGYCRRYAPVSPEPGKPSDAMWPIVRAEDWCLEHCSRSETGEISGGSDDREVFS